MSSIGQNTERQLNGVKLNRKFIEKVSVLFHKEGLNFTGTDSPMNKLMLQMMGAFAEFERNLIHERQAEGIATAKNKDVKFGKTSKVTPDQVLEVKTMGADRYSKIGNCQIRSEPLHFSLIQKLTAHLSGFLAKSCLPASNCAWGW